MTSLGARLKYWAWLFVVMFMLLVSKCAHASVTDLKLSTAQIFDVQWNITGSTLNASGFNYIYASVNYSTQTTSAARWTAAQTSDANSNGRYITFVDSPTVAGTYGMVVKNADGSIYKWINKTGTFRALANGAIFYNGNGMWGTLITTGAGYSLGQSGQWTITANNPTSAQLTAYTPPSSTPLAAGQTASATPPPPAPTPIYNSGVTAGATTYITNHYPTSNNSPAGEGAANAFDNDPSTKYLNFDKYNAGVTVKLNAGRVVTGFTLTTASDFPGRDPTSYKLYGSNDGVNWTLIQQGAVSLSDNRLATSSVITVTNTTAYAYYYIFFPTTKAGDGCGLNCDSMQISEITFIYDANSTTTSTASGSGSGSTVSNPGSLCCGGTAAPFSANSGFSSRSSAWTANLTGDNAVIITQIGNYNATTVTQTGRKNYAEVNISGSNNTTGVSQTANSSTQLNYIEANINGSSNSTSIQQSSTGGSKGVYATVNNNSNSVTVNQTNAGNHYAEINLSGGSKTVNITQQGSAGHMAKIELSGGTTQIDTTQSGSTQQFYSINYNCAQSSCSAITVTQGQ